MAPHALQTFTRAINAQRASLGANQADEIEDALVEHDKRFAMLSKTIDEQAAKIAELEGAIGSRAGSLCIALKRVGVPSQALVSLPIFCPLGDPVQLAGQQGVPQR